MLGSGKRGLNGFADGGNFQQAYDGEERFDVNRRPAPEGGQRPDIAVAVGMEDAFVPATGAIGLIGIIADHV